MRRPRRLRKSESVRQMVSETHLLPQNFVYPIFITQKASAKEAITALPGQYRLGMKELLSTVEEALKLGVRSIALFPKVDDELKDSAAKESCNPDGLVPDRIRKLKREFPELCVISDVALDPYSSDGHDGLVQNGEILNDETLPILSKMALVHAEAGVDFVAPSDMMDGRVAAIRKSLDGKGYKNTGIISYSAKYASAFYGPFRDALDSAPRLGDKKTYQMDPRNGREAILEALLDYREGADILMVKPAISYLDVIQNLKRKFPIPIAAYNVSGEYSMIKLAAEKGILNHDAAMFEQLTSIRRAGADLIFTYFALEAAKKLRDS